MEQVKLLSMTVILTVLVWWSADSLVNEAVSVSVTFEAVPEVGTPDLILKTVTPNEPYELQISGPRRIVEEVQARPSLHVRLPIPDRPTGPATIRLDRGVLKREMAEQWNEFRKLTIVSVQPDTLPVVFDHWLTREVDIVLSRLALAYDAEPQLSRTSATVRMRESFLNDLSAGQPLRIDIAPDVERLLRERPPGRSATVTIPVKPDQRKFGPDVELTPGTVTVTATVKAQRSTEPIPTVPILVAVSFANLEKPYRAVTRGGSPLSLVTQTITVTGPTEDVARLARGTTRAYGMIHLKQEDHLPPGVELAEEPPPIEFRLIDVTETVVSP